jgi:pimeloyl-ACP methyl ester carboxylesterase
MVRVVTSLTILIFGGLAVLAGAGMWVTSFAAQRIGKAHPPAGRFVDVAGGTIHVVELGGAAAGVPIVLIHGASGNLEDMRGLGERLASRHRVLLIDRPGHGWSGRANDPAEASPDRQAARIAEALDNLGASRAIVIGHSFGGTVAAALALAEPRRVAGLVLLAPVTHPWPGSVAWYYTLTATPVIGPLFARTVALPLGLSLISSGVDGVFTPNATPPDYIERTAARLVLRPAEFSANAADVVGLKEFVRRQANRYGELTIPVGIVSGDSDDVVSVDIHSRATADAVKRARLEVLKGIGHMPHHIAADAVIRMVDEIAAQAIENAESAQTQR